jgi:preprotein translocase subunit YajC
MSEYLSTIIMIVVLVVLFYFLLIRPESKKKKKMQAMRDALAVGDNITTIGGVMGKIVSVKDDAIVIETSEDRVRIQFTKWAVSNVGKGAGEEPQK